MTQQQLEALEPTQAQEQLVTDLENLSPEHRVERLEKIAEILCSITPDQIEHCSKVGTLKDFMMELVEYADDTLRNEDFNPSMG